MTAAVYLHMDDDSVTLSKPLPQTDTPTSTSSTDPSLPKPGERVFLPLPCVILARVFSLFQSEHHLKSSSSFDGFARLEIYCTQPEAFPPDDQ